MSDNNTNNPRPIRRDKNVEKELCRGRIKVLQSTKDKLSEEINPLLSNRTMDLYKNLEGSFNKAIDDEAKYLTSLKESD